MFLFVALLSVLVPLSLCVVPSLARLTIFPLITALVNRLASAYLQPCLKVEYGFGAWEDRPGAPSGTTITLFFVKLANAFLQTLAFAKQGIAPVTLRGVAVEKLTIHFTMGMKVVLELEDVDVDALLIDPNADGVFEVADAAVMKANDVAFWLTNLVLQKTRDEQQQQIDAGPAHAFSYKDRIVQHVMAQIDVKITNVRVTVTSHDASAAQTQQPSTQSQSLTRATSHDASAAQTQQPSTQSQSLTRATISVGTLALTTKVQHDDAQQALDLVLTSEDIRVQHTVRITDIGVYAQQLSAEAAATAPGTTDTAVVATDSARLKTGPRDGAVALFVVPEVALVLDVPPMARVLRIVENIAPVPLAKRVCRAELVLGGTNAVALAREPLAYVLRDLLVPVLDYQTLVKSVRLLESDKTAASPALSDDDRAFYIANFGKADAAAKLLAIEATVSIDELTRLRSAALGLNAHFDLSATDFTFADVIAFSAKLARRPDNVMFKSMQIALQLTSLSVAFVEADTQVAEVVFAAFNVHVQTFATIDKVDSTADDGADDTRTQDIDVQLEHMLFVVHCASTASGPAASPASKLVYADFSNAADVGANATRPQVLRAHVVQHASGKQLVAASLNHLQIVAAADALEYFLMSVDRLSTSANAALATARPSFEALVPPESGGQDSVSDGSAQAAASATTLPTSKQQQPVVSMAPFSLLGGKELELTVAVDDCHVVLTPARTFAKSFYSDIDVVTESRSSAVINCRVDLPLTLKLAVTSTATRESIELEATNVGMLARYLDSSDDAYEALLAPTSIHLAFTLAQDATDARLHRETVAVHMPDCVFAFSDLSLALMASCVQALSTIETTTPEQAQLKRASRLQQADLQRQAQLDVVLSRMRRLFEDIDTNQNGQIELNELLLLLRRVKVGDALLERELEYFVRVLFNEIDRDGNGYLEFDELRAFLRDDLLMNDSSSGDSATKATASVEAAGTSDLSGFLNLRGGEYRSTQVLEQLCDATITSAAQFCDQLTSNPSVAERFWDLFTAEARVERHSIGTQAPLDVQKKLVRLLQNYEAAQFCWNTVVAPSLDEANANAQHDAPSLGTTAWLVQPFTPCGGVSEYQSAARVIAKRKRDGIFSAAMSETEQLVQLASKTTAIKKQLVVSTDIQVGNVRFVLTDAELPARYCRGDFNVQDVTVSVELSGKDIDENGPVDWIALATSESAAWTALFGVHIAASCYSEIADDMESVIEPWELNAGLSAVEGENGFSVLVEAAKRFQINVTPGLLKTYRTLMDVLDGEAEQTALQQHQDGMRSALASRAADAADCLVQNSTGVAVTLTLNGATDALVLAPNESKYVKCIAIASDGTATLNSLAIAEWGATAAAVALPQFGSVNVPVVGDAATLFVTAFCRLEDPNKQRLVLKSNLYFCNHSSQVYNVKYLTLGAEGRDAVPSQVFTLRPNERMTLPLTVLRGVTEVYARPERCEQWIIRGRLDNDVLVSTTAVDALYQYETARASTSQQRRGGTIVFGETDESCTHVVKQLAPNMLVRRWHLRTHFEWEVALLPPFVVRNSLPYTVEYRFAEYNVKAAGANVTAAFARLENVLRDEAPALDTDVIFTGTVASGQDTEIAGVSCLAPGYIAVRVVASNGTASPWSKAMLMAIHAPVEQFSIARELVQLSNGAQLSVDRLSLPGLPRVVRFFSPYWIVNSTSFDFAYASTAPGAKRSAITPLDVPPEFTHPIITSLAYNRLSLKPIAPTSTRPAAWDALGLMPATAVGPTPSSDDIVARATWSEPMNTATINTVGEFVCGPAVFAVKVEGLFGMFEPGVGLTLSPRFFVQNRTKEKLFVQSFGATESDAEKVTDQFRKRSAADVEAFHVALEHGETTPMYHFAPLKRSDDLSKCQKFVSVSFTTEWDGKASTSDDATAVKWSFAIPINAAGDLYVQMYSPTRQKDIICQASVQVIDMYVYVILSDVSSAPPYRIENYTPFTIECAQLGESSLFHNAEKEKRVTVVPGTWHAFAWYNPLSKDRDVEIRVSHRDALKPKSKKYDIDYVGYHESLTLELALEPGDKSASAKKTYEIVVQVVVEESTRVFKFVEKELELQRFEGQDAELETEFAQRKMLFASSFDIRFAGFGLSLLDAAPQEVFFASLDVLTVQKAPATLAWVFSILNLQLDDMLASAKFPVILNPIDAGYSDRSVGNAAPKPFLRLTLDADLAAKVGTYKLLDVDLSSVSLKVDIDYLLNLVKLLEPYLVSDATIAIRSATTLETTLARRVPPVPGMQITSDGTIAVVHNDLVYFDVLRIHAISIELEYAITRNDIVSSTGGNGRSVVVGFLSQVIGLVGSNLSGSPSLSFNEIVILRCLSTKQRLQNQLVQNYIRQGVLQAYRLVGSADIIGNPIGLVEDLGSGVMQFLKITKGEVLGDAQTRGEGVKVLGKTIVKSGASTVAKITGSLDRFVGEFADDDDDDQRTTNNGGADGKSNDSPTGIAPLDGGIQFAKDFGKGLTGIFTKPVQGAMRGGVTGLVQGTVSGIAGPGVVILKRLTSTSHSLALGVQSTVVDRSVFGGRRRQPKLIVRNKLIAEFDESHYKPTRLTLEVISASGLLSDDSCDPLCVVRIDNKVVLKTRVLYNTLNPVWNEKTQVELSGGESEVQVIVKDSYGGAIDKTIGKCILSMATLRDDFKPPAFASNLAAWVKTGVKPDDTKTNKSHHVSEKEYELLVASSPRGGSALLNLGGSASKLRAAENDFQVIVTIESVEDLKTTSASGGGMLGLGNLGSSTPNITPYISIHVGANVSRTNTAKMTFTTTDNKKTFLGAATWHETFTFPYASADVASGKTPSAVTFSLKDKSMLHDERLGRAVKTIDLSTVDKPAQVERIKWTEKGDDAGDALGYLNVKVEIVSAIVTAPTDEPAIDEVEAEDDAVPTPKAAAAAATPRGGIGALGSIKAGKVRIACEFV